MIHYGAGGNAVCGATTGQCVTVYDQATCQHCQNWMMAPSRPPVAADKPTQYPRPLTEYRRIVDSCKTASDDELGIMTPQNRHQLGAERVSKIERMSTWHASERTNKHRVVRDGKFPTVNAALVWYAEIEYDGFPESSISAAFVRRGNLGTAIQSSEATDSAAIQAADKRHTIGGAISIAWKHNTDNGLRFEQWKRLMLTRATERFTEDEIGTHLSRTPHQVRSVFKLGRQWMFEYLVERELVRGR